MRPETITLYDQDGNETVFTKHFETRIRGVIYNIFTIVGREHEGGFVFRATPKRGGEFNYEIVTDQRIVNMVFEEFNQGDGEEPEEDEAGYDVPHKLYIPWEVDSQDRRIPGWDEAVRIIGSIRVDGESYVITVTSYERPGFPKGTPIVFHCEEVERGRGESGTTLEVVTDYSVVERAVDAFQRVDRSAVIDYQDGSGEFGMTNESQVTPFEDENGNVFQFSSAACLDVRGSRYFLLLPAFDAPGIDNTTALVYRLRRDRKGTRFLELTLDPNITNEVFTEYQRLESAGLGFNNTSDDDLF